MDLHYFHNPPSRETISNVKMSYADYFGQYQQTGTGSFQTSTYWTMSCANVVITNQYYYSEDNASYYFQCYLTNPLPKGAYWSIEVTSSSLYYTNGINNLHVTCTQGCSDHSALV